MSLPNLSRLYFVLRCWNSRNPKRRSRSSSRNTRGRQKKASDRVNYDMIVADQSTDILPKRSRSLKSLQRPSHGRYRKTSMNLQAAHLHHHKCETGQADIVHEVEGAELSIKDYWVLQAAYTSRSFDSPHGEVSIDDTLVNGSQSFLVLHKRIYAHFCSCVFALRPATHQIQGPWKNVLQICLSHLCSLSSICLSSVLHAVFFTNSKEDNWRYRQLGLYVNY